MHITFDFDIQKKNVYVFATTKVKSINSKWNMQSRAGRFVTNRHRYTSNVGSILQQLNWRSLDDGCINAWLVMMY